MGANRIQPIAVRDVLHYLLGAARVPADTNRAVDIGGPEVLRYGQMMNGYALEAGLRQRPIASLPVLTPGLASLENECVVKVHAVDDLIPRAEGGLTP